ncbi:MAG: gliding motility-associated C-terminal domain-containing protein [Cyclobacteriaceae bacterium]
MSKILRSNIFLILCGLLLFSEQLGAQSITETQWYFGNSAEALVFDKSSREFNFIGDQNVPFGTHGSTVITHMRKGNLLFYSDGDVIYDGSHQILPGMGTDRLNGDQTKIQPVVSAPVPGDTSRYFIFSNSGTEILLTTVSMELVGNSTVTEFPLGDVEGAVAQPTGLTNQGEVLKVFENSANNSFWLVTQDTVTLEFWVTEINAGGLGATTTYDVFPNGIAEFEASAVSLKEDSTGTTLAIAPVEANRNIVLLDFNDVTGDLSFNSTVINSGFSDGGELAVFDVEWSNNGTKLYLSRTGDGTNAGEIYQIDFADTTNANPPVAPVVNNNLFASYGLRRAVDGNIYHLYQAVAGGPFQVGTINRPDSSVNIGVLYTEMSFDADFQGTQFPEFAPDNLTFDYFDMSFTYLDSCQGSATKFIASVSPLPNNLFWDFGDGSNGQGPVAIHTYSGAFGGMVTLTVELDDRFQQLSLPVDIIASDTSTAVDLGNDTTICVDEVLPLDAGTGLSWLWSTGDTTQTIQVDTAGTYWVEVVGPSGCTSFDDIIVTEYGVQRQVFNQWYFGDLAGLDFNTTPPSALLDGMLQSDEGCATMSDQNGELLFYTNGTTVWNKEHLVMVNGTNIGGDSTAAQSAMILPFTGDNTMFYVFTSEEVYGDFSFNLKVSIVDMKADRARGKVSVKNIPIIECSTERVTASGFTGTPWLLGHEYGNRHYRAYQVNNNGITNAVHSAAGEAHIFQKEPNATGYMKFAPGANLVATVIPGSPNQVDILDFDNITGGLSNSRVIDIQETDQAYGLEFSGDGLKMYVSTGAKILQYDLDSLNSDNPEADIMATKFEIPNTTLGGYGALQMGPDGVIYVAIDGQTQVGSINSPGGDDASSGYVDLGVDLLGRTSRLGLPNFSQQVASSPPLPGITTQIACAGQPTSFTATGRDNSIENYIWDFGDTTMISNEQNPIHVYQRPGTYIVQLTLSNRCDTDSIFTDTLDVFNIPQIPTVPTDTSLCGSFVTLSAWNVDEPNFSYYWSTGDTTRSVTFFEPTIVDVAIINSDGCGSDTLSVFIGEDESFIDLGLDRLICADDSLVLDTNDPGPTYAWYRNGTLVGDQRTHAIYNVGAGDYTYIAEVTNDISGCTYRDTIQVTIQPSPEYSQAGIVTPNCGESDGAFSLNISSTGAFIYSLEEPIVTDRLTFDGPGETPAFTGLAAGTYTARVENAVTGCNTQQLIQLEDNAPFDMEAVGINECARNSDIVINFNQRIPSRINVNVFSELGDTVFTATDDLFSSRYAIDDLDSGIYYVEVRDLNPPNCLQIDTVQLSVSTECYRTIFAPNAFSPNGNGLNDEWFLFPNEFVDQFEIYILNRWGDVVFYSDDKNFRWAGDFVREEVLLGTYAYRILFTSSLEPELGTIEQLGSVTVVK